MVFDWSDSDVKRLRNHLAPALFFKDCFVAGGCFMHVAPDIPYFFDPLNRVIHCMPGVFPFINLG
jgi:hypothetical protein